MAKIRQEMMDRFQAQRQAQGGQPGGAPQAGAAGAAAPQAGATAAPAAQGQAGQTFNRQGGGQGGGQNRPQMPRVWVQDPDGKLRMVMLRTGVSDTNYSEIVRSELKEGDVILLGTMTASSTTQSGPGMGGMMFMGGPPPGGRR
jgi:HlyD family secretion protein